MISKSHKKSRKITREIAQTDSIHEPLGQLHGFRVEIKKLIEEENLKESETRAYIENALRDGEVKTTGTDIDKLMPPVSRFGSGKRAAKKQIVIEKLKILFDRFYGIV